MTIDDMQFYIYEYFPCNYPAADKIIAALHAGQAMRDNPGSAKAMYEWDQATKGKE